MLKKTRIISILLALALAICVGSSGCSAKGKKTLVVANWKGYGSDTSYAISEFEKANNCKVVHQYFTSEDELVNMLKQGGVGKIDVMLPNLSYVHQLASNGLAEPLDTSKLENYGDIMPSLKNQGDLKGSDGSIYGIPWTWGTTAIGYNPGVIKTKPTSISVLWDKQFKGKVAFNDDYNCAILTAALYLKSKDPYNPDLGAVKKALIDVKNNSKLLWSSYDDFSKSYASGSVVVGNLWSGAATQLKAEGTKLEYVYPSEGAVAWQDNWCIAKNAPEKELAYKWLNFMTSKEFLTKYTDDLKAQPPAPANKKVLDSLSVSKKKSLFIYPDLPKNLVMLKSISKEENAKWVKLWNEVKAS